MDAIHPDLREAVEKMAESVRKVKALMADAEAATARARHARAFELYERALAVAEAELQPDSLVQAQLLRLLQSTRIWHVAMTAGTREAFVAGMPTPASVLEPMWRDDPTMLALAQRSLSLLHARWRDGTLDKLRVDESLALYDEPLGPHAGCGMYIIVTAAAFHWPPPLTRAAAEERAWFVYGALHTTLLLDERGLLRDDAHTGWPDNAAPDGMPPPRPVPAAHDAQLRSLEELNLLRCICKVLHFALVPELLTQLRATCGLSHGEEAALRRLAQRQSARLERQEGAGIAGGNTAALSGVVAKAVNGMEAKGERALARHGLRACALPDCERVEPEPKAFKLCSRCQHVVYCCKEHQAADWRRHKRADCTRPAA